MLDSFYRARLFDYTSCLIFNDLYVFTSVSSLIPLFREVVEATGFEPVTFALQTQCSTN
jgi:hypothetical protein